MKVGGSKFGLTTNGRVTCCTDGVTTMMATSLGRQQLLSSILIWWGHCGLKSHCTVHSCNVSLFPGAALCWDFCYLQLMAFLVVMVPTVLAVLLGRQGTHQVFLLSHPMTARSHLAPAPLSQAPGGGREGQARWKLPCVGRVHGEAGGEAMMSGQA